VAELQITSEEREPPGATSGVRATQAGAGAVLPMTQRDPRQASRRGSRA